MKTLPAGILQHPVAAVWNGCSRAGPLPAVPHALWSRQSAGGASTTSRSRTAGPAADGGSCAPVWVAGGSPWIPLPTDLIRLVGTRSIGPAWACLPLQIAVFSGPTIPPRSTQPPACRHRCTSRTASRRCRVRASGSVLLASTDMRACCRALVIWSLLSSPPRRGVAAHARLLLASYPRVDRRGAIDGVGVVRGERAPHVDLDQAWAHHVEAIEEVGDLGFGSDDPLVGERL